MAPHTFSVTVESDEVNVIPVVPINHNTKDWEAPCDYDIQPGESYGPYSYEELKALGNGTHTVTVKDTVAT